MGHGGLNIVRNADGSERNVEDRVKVNSINNIRPRLRLHVENVSERSHGGCEPIGTTNCQTNFRPVYNFSNKTCLFYAKLAFLLVLHQGIYKRYGVFSLSICEIICEYLYQGKYTAQCIQNSHLIPPITPPPDLQLV